MSIEDIRSQAQADINAAAEIARLAALSPFDYDRCREQAAKDLGVRVGTLDKEVATRRSDDDKVDDTAAVEDVTAWPEPVDGAVIDEIRDDFGRHVVTSPECLDTMAVWCIGTYCYDAFPIWSKLFFSSPERRCGKTVALEVLEANCLKALMASSITSSAIFRAVNEWRPTLIVDEADTFGKDDEELAGIINAGHRKRSAIVIRNVKVGDEYLPKKFSVWSPMAIAAIGRLRDTVMDRSVIVHMRRKAPGEKVEKVPADLFERNRQRRQRCLRWAEDRMGELRITQVEMPHHGNDRLVDNWAPLFSIAAVIGGEWPHRVRAAFGKLSVEEEEESIGPMLLSDVREVFEDKRVDKIASQGLVDALIAMEDRPWVEWRHGKAMTQNSLARLLKPYKILPGNVRLGTATPKGYHLRQFSDAWKRYLGPPPCVDTPQQSATPPHPSNGGASRAFESATNSESVAVPKCHEPSNGGHCGGVAVQKGGTGGNGGCAEVFSDDDGPEEAWV